jgi:hypothetical protein
MRRGIWIGAAGAAAGVLVVLLFNTREAPPSSQKAGGQTNSLRPKTDPSSAQSAAGHVPLADPAGRFGEAVRLLNASFSAENSRRLLAGLRDYLSTLPPDAASLAIREFLETGMDAPTRLGFIVAAKGQISESPSLRVFLLDALGRMDRTAAGRQAEEILASPTTPDEWAVSLRNYAWSRGEPAATEFLKSKALEMIATAAWRERPSAGFLEAFDVLVYARADAATPLLASLSRDSGNRAVAHAAYLTLDRLTLAEPASILSRLNADPELLTGREAMRSNLFARADVRDPAQKVILEEYLLDPNRTAAELTAFAGIYPNANLMLSNNLLTQTSTPDRTELLEGDRAALECVAAWAKDPRFAQRKEMLEELKRRLEKFVP